MLNYCARLTVNPENALTKKHSVVWMSLAKCKVTILTLLSSMLWIKPGWRSPEKTAVECPANLDFTSGCNLEACCARTK